MNQLNKEEYKNQVDLLLDQFGYRVQCSKFKEAIKLKKDILQFIEEIIDGYEINDEIRGGLSNKKNKTRVSSLGRIFSSLPTNHPNKELIGRMRELQLLRALDSFKEIYPLIEKRFDELYVVLNLDIKE